MAFEHPSGIPGTFDRAQNKPEWQSLVFGGDGERFVQAAELNEAQTVIRGRHRRLGRLIAKDGDRVDGAAAIVDAEAGQVILTPGRLYVRGDVLPVAQAVLSDVPMAGSVEIGVRLLTEWIDHEDDPTLVGLVDGSLAQGEPGAARERVSLSWALIGDGGAGEFVPVYLMVDGTIIDQTPPPSLDGINQAIAIYDRGAHGSYVVSGCRVTALGKIGASQAFSIEEGEANINGFKRTRYEALRHLQEEDCDIEEVAGEVKTWPAGAGAQTFTVNLPPIAAVNSVLVTKEVTDTITRGGTAGGSDALGNNSVTQIIEVKQGGTTYTVTTDYVRTGDAIDWSPAGAEPATGSSYTVKYRYLALVTPTSFTDTTITLPAGGVEGTNVIIGYDWKLPRIDVLCLNETGRVAYVKGISARRNPLPPAVPPSLLPLAEIANNWSEKPAVVNSGIRSVPYAELWRFLGRIIDHERLIQLERIKSGIDAREPVAKKGLFVDPFTSDFYRDEGVVQTASVGDGVLELAITPTFFFGTLTEPVMLNYTEEVIIEQDLKTGCMKVNPYQNFNPMPAGLKISPAADYWEVAQTQWASPATVEFNRGIRRDNGPLVVSSEATQVVDQRQQQATFLRQIAVAFVIEGMGVGEILETLTFDGIDVKPEGEQTADANGEITGSFVIPSNIPAGAKIIEATGQGGSRASATFVGQGVITTTVLRRVTTIERWERPRVVQERTVSGVDPLAQTFTPPEARQLVGIDFHICAVGEQTNALLVHQVSVEVGIPTQDVVAEAFVSMVGAETGWKSARYNLPVLTRPDRESAVVIKTDDADHSLSIATVGDFDADRQSFVAAQPYTTGVLLSSSNASTWTPHQNDDLTFRLVAAKFGPLTKTVSLGSFDLVNCSDLQVRADVELPSPDCSVVFEIVRADNSVIRLLPYQVLQLTEYVTETVQLRAILSGTEKLSPVLFPPVVLVAGEIATSGTYVTRAFKLGSAVKLTSYIKANLPSGSTLAMEYDQADGDWQTLPFIANELLSDPRWIEKKYEQTGITATEGRIRITITGGPAARPLLGDFGAAVM
ncbi:hypothetical protein [Microcystis phage Mae-JY30]